MRLKSFYLVNTTEAGNGVLLVRIKQNGNEISHEQTHISTHLYQVSFIPETLDNCDIQISYNGDNNCKYYKIHRYDRKQRYVCWQRIIGVYI